MDICVQDRNGCGARRCSAHAQSAQWIKRHSGAQQCVDHGIAGKRHTKDVEAIISVDTRYIDINDAEEVLRAILMTDADVPLHLVLHAPGGLVLAALQIAKAVREHKARVTVFVPHYAMSGGTLIALAANEIVMCEHSVLGPIDPQLGDSPAASLIKVVEQKPWPRSTIKRLSWPTSDAKPLRTSNRRQANC